VQRYEQFSICAEALWMQEIKPQCSIQCKILMIVVFEFAMYLLALKIEFKNIK
jgi:hypothetical protein